MTSGPRSNPTAWLPRRPRGREPVLISVHVPKTAGTSTGALLARMFSDELVLDYDENPATPLAARQIDPCRYLRRRVSLPAAVRAVHGHFHPAKYLDFRNARWFTVLRWPPALMISIYSFWTSATFDDPLHRYFIEERLSVEELARLPILRTLLSETYFGGFDMAVFDIIGRHETREDSLRGLERLLGRSPPPDERLRETPGQAQMQEMLHDDRLCRRLESILAQDVAFYERWGGR